jgi:hypothetical protein
LRLPGWFLLRTAERRFCGLLFQEPPCRTRRDALPPVQIETLIVALLAIMTSVSWLTDFAAVLGRMFL